MRKTNATLTALICVATMVWADAAFALNPQPLPPRRFPTFTTSGHYLAARPHLHNGVNAGPRFLNPQPLPPG
jgi:hypothetical protein